MSDASVLTTLTRRSLRARWVRFLLCASAVVVGVAFVVGSFVLSDSLRRVFGDLADTITETTDVEVRAVDPFAGPDAVDAARAPLPASLVDAVAAVDGVATAHGSVSGDVVAVAPDGELIENNGPPVLALGETDPADADGIELVAGSRPAAGEVMVDDRTAQRFDIEVGETVTVRAVAGGDYTVSGLVSFADGGAGASYLVFDLATAQALLGHDGTVGTIVVQGLDGVGQAELRDRIAAVLPDGVEAITGAESAAEFSSSFDGIIDIFRNILLAFAFITLFVAAFLINTVFNTTVGQRVRELAMLRAIGARDGQVRTLVLAESFAIGVVGSLLGALGGVGVAALLKAIISGSGGGLPDGPLVLSGTTWLVAFAIGIGVTMAVSALPAWRAGQVPAVAALRDGHSPFAERARARLVTGAAASAAGLAAFGFGLAGDIDRLAVRLTLLGAGAVAIFLGVAGLAPLFTRRLALSIGSPFTVLFGTSGRLAQANAARNPRRTASTAAALMIGVALVSTQGVIGASFKATFVRQLDQGITADWFAYSEGAGMPAAFAERAAALDGIEAVSTFRQGSARIDGDVVTVIAPQPVGLDRTMSFRRLDGTVSPIPADGLLVAETVAEDRGLAVGDVLEVTFPVDGPRPLRVTAVFDSAVPLGDWMISQDLFAVTFPPEAQLDQFGGLTVLPGTDPAQVTTALEQVAAEYPEVVLQDRSTFKADQQAQLDQASTLIYALLGMSVVVAVIGIAITLSLAIFERTREFGLLRAVGQQRRQTRRMVRLEAVIVAVLGAGLGIALGTTFGLATAAALPDAVVEVIRVPWLQLAATLAAAAVAGIGASLLPAWRAGRLKVLDAIAYE
ncbi:MAG: ABC transporter permease [Acidimicrobiia bacterium]